MGYTNFLVSFNSKHVIDQQFYFKIIGVSEKSKSCKNSLDSEALKKDGRVF